MPCTNTLNSKASARAAPARRVFSYLSFLLLAFFALPGLPSNAMSAPGGLEGAWRGRGWVSFSSGKREQARCRVHFSTQSAHRYAISAICATESGKVSQTAMVRKAGANIYVGNFYNAEYDVSGTIRLTIHGNTQTARLTSGSGSALITLSR